jgi:glycosyltransferase involved in cell wall biosynthesis
MEKKLVFTVTNDLVYDQRMRRICNSLALAGYDVTLIGRRGSKSPPLSDRSRGAAALFTQLRLRTWARRGKLFYLEFNTRLLFYLLFRKMDAVCAIDLDTVLPCYLVSLLRRVPRLFDAHELFCEMQEVVTRPFIYKVWKTIERSSLPSFPAGYTVNAWISEEFRRLYGVNYAVIRNIPLLEREPGIPNTRSFPDIPPGRFILYQGAVNEGRCFEYLIPAMRDVPAPLVICGDGNFMQKARSLVRDHGLEDKVLFMGMVLPEQLPAITRSASIGITLFEKRGTSNYLSLANRFFDYMHAGIPQIAMNFPAYREINNSCPIAVLIDNADIRSISSSLNKLLNDNDLFDQLAENCKQARLIYNWQEEEKKLLDFYQQFFK